MFEYIKLRNTIEMMQRVVESRYSQATGTGSAISLPGSGSVYNDRVGNNVSSGLDVKEQLLKLQIQAMEKLEELLDCFNRMTDERLKLLLILRYVRGLSIKAIEEKMELGKTQVHKLLREAQKELET